MYDAPAPHDPPAETPALRFIPPESVRLGDRQQRVGGVVYRLLSALFDAPDRARSVADLERAVWGRSVPRNTLWSACRRARGVLGNLKHPLRVAIDGDRVALV